VPQQEAAGLADEPVPGGLAAMPRPAHNLAQYQIVVWTG
jgi:hypothetical protein